MMEHEHSNQTSADYPHTIYEYLRVPDISAETISNVNDR